MRTKTYKPTTILAILLALFAILNLIPEPQASAQSQGVRIMGVNSSGRDVPVRGSEGAVATRPYEVTSATTLSSANTTVTLTLTGVASKYHYITRLVAVRSCTTAIAGSALLAYTTTNLPGSLAFTAGNACAVGSTNFDFDFEFAHPLKSSVAGTNTTIVAPAAGVAGSIRLTAFYYTAE